MTNILTNNQVQDYPVFAPKKDGAGFGDLNTRGV